MITASAIASAVTFAPRRHGRPRGPQLGRAADRAKLAEWHSPEQLLWRSMLYRMLADSIGVDMVASSGEQSRRLDIDRARNWLTNPSPDRAFVFSVCGIDLGWFDDRLAKLRDILARIDAGTHEIVLPRPGRRRKQG